jgi:hypothetical protein
MYIILQEVLMKWGCTRMDLLAEIKNGSPKMIPLMKKTLKRHIIN